MTGRYRLVESIGQGGMGRVWRATDEMLDRQVAVKEMRIDGLDAEDTRTRRERTLREARATARINHPNVVRIYDVVDESDRLWIVMELVDGRSLERIVMEDGPLGPGETARIGRELVAALRQVHAGGVLHRDIKPGNVLVENRGRRVVLTDFGIAAIQDAKALTMVGMLVGSPDYMAPERVSGRPQGPPSDVWSLGATLCAALGGHSPFSRSTTLATLHAVLYEEPELPAEAGELRQILAALLEKEPSVRPGLEEVATALEALVAPGPGHTETPARAQTVASASALPTPLPSPVQPHHPHHPHHPEAPLVPPTASPAVGNASTEAPSEGRAEPLASGVPERAGAGERPSRGDAAPETGSHAALANAVTASRLPGWPGAAPAPSPMPPGELPGPALPSAPRPARHRRRTGLAAAGGVAAAGAIAALVIAATSGSPGHDHDASSSTSAALSASSGGPSQSPTVDGTSRPPSPPPGSRTEAGMYAWVPPKGWKRVVQSGTEVHYTSPDAQQEILANATPARGDLLKQWQVAEVDRKKGLNYRRIRLEQTTFRGAPAVVWEYNVTAKGQYWHVRLLGFRSRGTSYEISTWYHPDIEAGAVPAYERVKKSFTPL
ncbi:protein kinase [Streptomyces avermitilis]